jgi:hypothetical protein
MKVRTNAIHKAIIQTSKTTGVNRVFYRKKINGKTRIVETHAGNLSRYSVTGYTSLREVAKNLTDCTFIGRDEKVMFMDQNVDEVLGLSSKQVRINKIMKAREEIKRKFKLTDRELDAIISEQAA